MSGPPMQFPNAFANSPNSLRNQFSSMPMQNQMSTGMTQLSGQMGNPIQNQLMSNQMQGQTVNQSNVMGHYNMNQTQQNTMVQQQVLISNPVPTPPPPAAQQPAQQPPQPQQSKEFNTASLCRIGQETVQDIVSRTQEVFQTLKSIHPPNGTSQGASASNDKKVKVQEQLRTIRVLFKRLRLIYEKCNENCQLQGMEYTHIESLIPYRDDPEPKSDEKKMSEVYKSACDENKEVVEQVMLKNRQLKEAIDQLRKIIWEINTMLAMIKS